MKRISYAGLAMALCLATFAGCASQIDMDGAIQDDDGWAFRGSASAGAFAVDSLAFSPDGKKLASTHYPQHPSSWRVSPLFENPPGTVRIWEAKDYGLGRESWVDQASLTIDAMVGYAPLYFTPDGECIHVMGGNEVVRWNIHKLKPERFPIEDPRVISPDGRHVAVRAGNDQVVVKQVETSENRAELSADGLDMWPIGFVADGRLLAIQVTEADNSRYLAIYDIASQSEQSRCLLRTTTTIQMAHAKTRIATTQFCYGDVISIWDINDGSLYRTFNAGDVVICGIALSPDARLLAACTETPDDQDQGLILIWDIEKGELIKTIRDDATRKDNDDYWGVTAVAFSPDGKTLATGNSEGDVNFYSVPENHAE